MDDAQRMFAKFEAAVYLYELTNDWSYKDFVESNYTSIVAADGRTQWDADRQEALLYYTRLSNISAEVKSAILSNFVLDMTRNADQLPAITNNKDAYRSPIKDYTWGSNQSKLLQASLYELLALYDNDPATAAKADSAAMGYLHYIHGVNPLGLVYLTNMKSAGASHSASTMFHNWYAHGTRWERASGAMPGPPPGYLVGGPIHIIQWISVAPRLFLRRDTDALFRRPFHYAATVTSRRSGSRTNWYREFNEAGRRIPGK